MFKCDNNIMKGTEEKNAVSKHKNPKLPIAY